MDKWSGLRVGAPRRESQESAFQSVEGTEFISDDRRNGLVLSLGAIRKNHKGVAPDINDEIDKLIKFIESHEIAIADTNHSGSVFNRKSIVQYICEVFDPPLSQILPIGSPAWITLKQQGTPPPLIDHLKSKESLSSIADNLKLAAHALEENFQPLANNWNTMILTGESLSVVAEVLYAISDFLPCATLRWCGVCFRRVHKKSKYCQLHTLSTILGNDTAYRRAKKIWKTLPSDVLTAWTMYQSKRKVFGEAVELLCNPEDLSVSVHSKIILVSQEIKILMDITMHAPWRVASGEWEYLLTGLQYVTRLLTKNPKEFNEWNEYCCYVLENLDDRDEESRHPFWILNILFCAEDWLKTEHDNTDGRTTDTEKKVMDLYWCGITDPLVLSKCVDKSKQIIYRILKRNGLKHDSRN